MMLPVLSLIMQVNGLSHLKTVHTMQLVLPAKERESKCLISFSGSRVFHVLLVVNAGLALIFVLRCHVGFARFVNGSRLG